MSARREGEKGAWLPLGHVRVQALAMLQGATLTLAELSDLTPGATLDLGLRTTTDIDLMVHGQALARGQIVALGEQRGLVLRELPVSEAVWTTPPDVQSLLGDEDFGAPGNPVDGTAHAEGEAAAGRPYVPLPFDPGDGAIRDRVARVHQILQIEAAALLGGQLRLPLSVEFGAPDRCDPHTLVTIASETVLQLNRTHVGPFGILYLGPDLVRSIADRMLGGDGAPGGCTRPLRAVEQSVSARALATLGAALGSAWRPFTTGELDTEVVRAARFTADDGPFLAAPFWIRSATFDASGLALYSVSRLAEAMGAPLPTPGGTEAAPTLDQKLDAIPLAVSVQTPSFPLAVSELLALGPGTMLPLSPTSNLSVELHIEGSACWRGRCLIDRDGLRTFAVEEAVAGAAPHTRR